MAYRWMSAQASIMKRKKSSSSLCRVGANCRFAPTGAHHFRDLTIAMAARSFPLSPEPTDLLRFKIYFPRLGGLVIKGTSTGCKFISSDHS